MSDESNHELLSAYLDGELPDDQRQRVERLISESAEYRQVYEELCALRASFSSLPKHKVGEDLAPRVLRLAEEARAPARDGADIVPAGPRSPTRRASPSWRAIIYPAVAVAAAIAMLVSQQAKDKRKSGKEIAYNAAKPDFKRTTPDPPASMSAAPETADARHEPVFAKDQLGSNTSDADVSATESENLDTDKYADRKLQLGAANRPLAKTLPSLEAGSSGPQDLETSNVLKSTLSQKQRAGSKRLDRLPAKATLVLDCKLAPLAARDKAFENLLARNQLTPVSGPPDAEKLAIELREDRQYSANGGSPGFPSATKDKKLAKQLDQINLYSLPVRDDRWSEMVLVEMDAAQFVAVLNDLQNHPEQFLAIELAAKPTDTAQKSESETGNVITEEPAADEAAPDDGVSMADDTSPAQAGGDSAAPAPAAPQPPPAYFGTVGGMADGKGSVAAMTGPGRLRVLFRLSALPEK
jgi:negative regulator of sigma E activity